MYATWPLSETMIHGEQRHLVGGPHEQGLFLLFQVTIWNDFCLQDLLIGWAPGGLV